MKKRLTFDIPGLGGVTVRGRTERDAVGLQRRADRDAAQARKEVHGPTYELLSSQQMQAGEPVAHGVGQYQHPADLDDMIIGGAPRALPVSQEVGHGPERSREEEFERAVQEAAAYGKKEIYRAAGFNDRRFSGRRHRPTDNDEEEGY